MYLRNNSMKWAQLLIFGTIGLGLLSFGISGGLEAYPVFRNNVSTQGTVVDIVADQSGNKPDAGVIPVIEFVARNNTKVLFRAGAVSNDAPGFEKGSIINVLYDLNNPAKAQVGSYTQLWQRPLISENIELMLVFLSLLLFKKIGRFERALRDLGSDKTKNK
jgi:hypothetical protein